STSLPPAAVPRSDLRRHLGLGGRLSLRLRGGVPASRVPPGRRSRGARGAGPGRNPRWSFHRRPDPPAPYALRPADLLPLPVHVGAHRGVGGSGRGGGGTLWGARPADRCAGGGAGRRRLVARLRLPAHGSPRPRRAVPPPETLASLGG